MVFIYFRIIYFLNLINKISPSTNMGTASFLLRAISNSRDSKFSVLFNTLISIDHVSRLRDYGASKISKFVNLRALSSRKTTRKFIDKKKIDFSWKKNNEKYFSSKNNLKRPLGAFNQELWAIYFVLKIRKFGKSRWISPWNTARIIYWRESLLIPRET